MIELLMVIIIIAILIALLLPAINSAMKTARKAAVSSEIAQLAQALANFKAKYGDYPPSRFLAVENGNYSAYFGDTTPLSTSGVMPDHTQPDPTSPGDGRHHVRAARPALRGGHPQVLAQGQPRTHLDEPLVRFQW